MQSSALFFFFFSTLVAATAAVSFLWHFSFIFYFIFFFDFVAFLKHFHFRFQFVCFEVSRCHRAGANNHNNRGKRAVSQPAGQANQAREIGEQANWLATWPDAWNFRMRKSKTKTKRTE